MAKKKNMDHGFYALAQSKSLAPLVLDQKWHHLFSTDGKSKEVQKLEKRVNKHLARQGHLNQELKELKGLKNKLMKNIVANMDEAGKESLRLQENGRLITEVNERMDACRKELDELQGQLAEDNGKLMAETMEYCYGIMGSNEAERDELAAWIARTRVELKKKIVRKEAIEEKNREIYAYLHDIFGARIIEAFDLKYADEYQNDGKG